MPNVPKSPPEPIAGTKLTPPRPARRLLAREALVHRLLDARHRRCVVVQGPAGCGKTSALVAWRQGLVALGFDVAWFSLEEEDNDPVRFFDCLLASIALVNADIAQKAAGLAGDRGDFSAAESWVVTLIEAIATQPRDLVLMLDDVHHIEDVRIWQALQWLLDYAPPHLHVVLCSRNRLSLSLARMHAQGLLSVFDFRDLRFNPVESEAYLREQLGVVSPREARQLHELTDGWIAGLQLFALDIKAKHGAGFSPTALRDAGTFAQYFDREVLSQLDADDQKLLTCAAICDRFSAHLCATLVGEPRAVARMMTRLVRLDSSNLFLIQVSDHDQESWYRLHPLLREVLLARVAAMPEERQRALHAAAWRWFEQRDYVEEAVAHAVLAGEAGAAADVILARASELLARDGLGRLTRLLRSLPAGLVESYFVLQTMQAHIDLRSRHLAAAEQAIEQLALKAATLGERERYAVTVLRGGLALMRDDISAATVLLPELERVPPDADDFMLTTRGNVVGWIHMHRGEYERAREVLADSTEQGGAMVSSLVGRCFAGLSLSIEGRCLEAEPVFRQVLHEAEQLGGIYVGAAHMAAVLLSETLYELNEIEAVCKLLEKRIERLEAVSVPDAVLRALQMLAQAHRVAGRSLESVAYLDRLEDYAVRHSLDRLLVIALGVRSRWLLLEGELDPAEAAVARAQALAGDGTRHAATWSVDFVATLAVSGLCLHRHDYDGALSHLTPLLESGKLASRGRYLAIVLMQCAVAERGRGNARVAYERLREALRYGQRFGLVRSLLDAAPHGARLIQEALQAQVFDPVLAFFARRLLEASERWRARVVPPGAVRRASPVLTLSEREAEVLKLISQAMSNKMVARTLSVSPETVKWHLKNIFIKLGVTCRDEAVALLRDVEADASMQGAGQSR
ncbi:LuxR C-terminal-related transcriptional regulator [Cupriavidus taiwanensis]|uniref:LuxR C-terminal-related transcriptional regulator n=1 Tax=Cupriavidus taiwanensis TaxID=164546 RepID=UPI000E10CE40|nr:LuxR C-terminal-related transcriptional regulator [Cupriavidus taiwanensis]SPA34252.1 putative ATP-dependent transcriptional regulator, LuxR-family [Cupriavidus taiwanensis]SPA54635.1 putative ATP-dependent transcriptional regulator, LuxR-family [Cupriavidus taiwanensis]